MSKSNVTVQIGHLFKVYFENLYLDPLDNITVCTVLADTTEEAIDKVHRAFPGEAIHMVSMLDNGFRPVSYDNKPPKRPKGEAVVF